MNFISLNTYTGDIFDILMSALKETWGKDLLCDLL